MKQNPSVVPLIVPSVVPARLTLGLCLSLGLALPACAGTGQPAPAAPEAPAASTAAPMPAAPSAGGQAQTRDEPVVHSDTPLLPRTLTSFGAVAHDGWLYVLGGYAGEPHAYSREGQSGALQRMRLADGQTWETLPGIEPLQSVALVAHGNALVRVGGMRALNHSGEPTRLVSVAEAARYLPGDARWQPLPDLPAGRSSHDAVVLDGKLYVLGGWRLDGPDGAPAWHDTGAMLDLTAPGQPAWTALPVPFQRRALAVAAAGGHVVAIGGMTAQGEVSRQVDLYDPATGSWRRGPDFPGSGFGVAAHGMGDVVHASGRDGTVYRLTVGEGAWTPVTTLAFPRFFHRLVRASGHRLMAVGGILGMDGRARVRPVEIVDVAPGQALAPGQPRVTRWTLRAPGRAKNRQGIFLRGHTLHVFGGNNSLGQHDFEPENFLAQAFRLHLGSLTWSPMAPYPAQRQTMQTTLLAGGEAGIAVGGFGHDGEVARTHADSFVYDFAQDAWTPRPGSLPVARSQFGLVLHDDALWVFGGLDYDPRRSSDAFHHLAPVLQADAQQPEASFQPSGVTLPHPRRAFGGALLGHRYYLVGGMHDNFQLVDTCDVYDFETRAWTTIPAPRRTRLSPQMVALDGKLYLAGGSSRSDAGDLQSDRSIEVFDPATKTWSVLLDELPIETRHMRMFAYGHRLLIYTAHTETDQAHLLLVDVDGDVNAGRAP